MRKGKLAVSALVVAAFLAVPLIAIAGDGVMQKSKKDVSTPKLVKAPDYREGTQTKTDASAVSDFSGPSIPDPSQSSLSLSGNSSVASGSDGLRALGDTDIVLFNAMDPDFLARFTGGEYHNYAQVMGPGDVAAADGKAYAVERISFPFVRICDPAKNTYAKITIGPVEPSLLDATCVDNTTPITTKNYTIIVNLGAPADAVCDTDFASAVATDEFDAWSIDLLTGDATSVLTSAVTNNVIVYSNLPAGTSGAIPMGAGDVFWVLAMYLGELNLTGDDVVAGPSGDACVTKVGATGPGGLMWMNWSYGNDCVIQVPMSDFIVDGEGNAGAGRPLTGVFIDGSWTGNGDDDTIPECGEGWFCATTAPGTHINARLEGAAGPDCNTNGIIDEIDIAGATSTDINGNDVPDDCELTDCDVNSIPDMCDFDCANQVPAAPNNVGPNGEGPWLPGLCSTNYPGCGTASDCNGNTKLDRCDPDCNANGVPDDCDIDPTDPDGDLTVLPDCNSNGIPDVCDVDPTDPDSNGFFWRDCDASGVPDACERFFTDCNGNDIDDYCDILSLEMNDADANGVPDACQARGNSIVLDFEDVASTGYSYDLGAVNLQPDPSTAPDPGFFSAFHWQTVDADLVNIAGAGYADVTAGSLGTGCGGAKKLVLNEVTSNGTPQADWAVWTPHVFFTVPETEVVTNFVPLYQEMSMYVKLNNANELGDGDANPDTTLDWDLYFGSIFDGPADSNTVYVNDFRVVVTFDTDTSTNSLPTEITSFPAPYGPTFVQVDWENYLGQEIELRVVIDLRDATSLSTFNSGHIYWDGVKIIDFTPNASENGTAVMDKLYVDQFRNDPEAGFGGATIEIDCIQLIHDRDRVSCEEFGFTDCDGNGTCDFFEEAEFDLDGNGILDHCEGFCADCNNNNIVDAYEIQQGSAPDVDMNDVIDYCEKSTHAVGFEVAEGYAVGELDGQEGWHNTGNALPEISATPTGGTFNNAWPREGTQYLVVKDNPDVNRTWALIFAPRQDAVPDADIELYTWDWGLNSNDFARMMVEIGDLCADVGDSILTGDGTGGDFDRDIWIASANAGLQLRSKIPGAVPATTIRLFALQNETSDHSYQGLAGVGPAGTDNVRNLIIADAWQPAGLRLVNSRGEIDILWTVGAEDQDDFQADPNAYVVQTFSQTLGTVGNIGAGGDAQIVIRGEDRPAVAGGDPSYPMFGAGATEFYFDDFRYEASLDCDADGVDDTDFLNGPFGAGYDVNGDGIPDNCQDCDDDCGPFPVASSTCLDPVEAAGVDGDCNANGIPDNCDIDPTLPYITMIEVAGCLTDPDNFLPNGECYEARYGGSSCDLNTNGTPDTCEGADCNGDGCLDSTEIDLAGGTGGIGGDIDVDSNGVPDECQGDCNNNGRPDGPIGSPNTDLNFGLGGGGSQDAFPVNLPNPSDGIPDECCVTCTGTAPNITCELADVDGDLDRDGDIDAQDYQFMQRCASLNQASFPHPQGSVVGSATGGATFDGVMCGCADFDASGVIDDADAAFMQIRITGPQ